ncbi:Rpn family recombination-promoting nuclease/putative transposase [Duganella radicis]|uniref:Transposase n=1 Tax=Duganella radicis TaxID=551988 RepID=A0A6L6PRU4_9BURK|nr:Rpn family recombination-promoting nuclease/putative transposase [Duganella radicis]MTV40955.1 transposase [Duganella radicis]
MTSATDALYKQLFSHPEIVRDLVAGFLPAAWARQLEVGAFERVNASYASEQGKTRHEDVVWRARIGGEWVYVYILLEFQSRPDKWMALRMQVYIGLLYQDLVAQHKLSKHGKLPPVLPIVLYHGRRPWRAATELAQLMLPAPDGLECFQARQRYLLIDQCHDGAHGDIVGLLFRVMSAVTESEVRSAATAFAQRVQRFDLASARASLMRWLRLTLQDDCGDSMMDREEDTLMPPNRKYRFEDVFTDEFFDRLLTGPDESREQGRQQGMQEGMREGRQQGMQEGMQLGERRALRQVLKDLMRGVDLPIGAVDEITSADCVQLRAWINALIGGASPRQLFAGG